MFSWLSDDSEKSNKQVRDDAEDTVLLWLGGEPGALLDGLDKLISRETNMPVYLCEDPLLAVALGTGKVLENIEVLKKVLIGPKKLI